VLAVGIVMKLCYEMMKVKTIFKHKGDLIVSELVLSKIFNGVLPDLEAAMLPTTKPSIVAALMEVYFT